MRGRGFYSNAPDTVNVHPHIELLRSFNLLLWSKHLIAEELALWKGRGSFEFLFLIFYLF